MTHYILILIYYPNKSVIKRIDVFIIEFSLYIIKWYSDIIQFHAIDIHMVEKVLQMWDKRGMIYCTVTWLGCSQDVYQHWVFYYYLEWLYYLYGSDLKRFRNTLQQIPWWFVLNGRLHTKYLLFGWLIHFHLLWRSEPFKMLPRFSFKWKWDKRSIN